MVDAKTDERTLRITERGRIDVVRGAKRWRTVEIEKTKEREILLSTEVRGQEKEKYV